MEHIVKIDSIGHVTHDVLRLVVEKPADYIYTPGQATDVSVNKDGWQEELRAFTFTSLPTQQHLEFTIKTYPARNGVTNQLLSLKAGDSLILHDVFGDINYKGEGLFIAGGAGVTPFLAIFRNLQAHQQVGNNQLIFANNTKADIIHEDEFNQLLGNNFINVLAKENIEGYENGFITEELLRKYITNNNKYVYLCGPPPMMDAVEKHLASLGIDEQFIVKEGF
ncbi:FAD-binding oxidoreductase [Solitalea canadensis]|uniref:Flavodoxin reductase family protein n=1 Tax=Solitalea canadensis (strain ATCC 29591 / DSM 3403 / JCM 21819 / LMG 8368 / NBRC 15130 / NCIMB 12057 / USAM 9D) TaxID=929556 RepID=H8KMM7_SOLCM|nr:FAD-binding oxidoreductase [Solitalea canadensis]AFD09018.1 flavodoxin reductase family protein [Solitalea canadensis DSM 3403]